MSLDQFTVRILYLSQMMPSGIQLLQNLLFLKQKSNKEGFKNRTKSITGFILPRADVESREEDSVVMVSALSTSQGGLPVAEAVQCVVCMVVNH